MSADYRYWLESNALVPRNSTQNNSAQNDRPAHYIRDIFDIRDIQTFTKKMFPTRNLRFAYIAMDSKYRDTDAQNSLLGQFQTPSAYQTPSWAVSASPYTAGLGVTSSYVSPENIHHMTLFNVVMPRGVTQQYNETPPAAANIPFDSNTLTTITEFQAYQAFIGANNRAIHFSGNNRNEETGTSDRDNRSIYQAVNLYNRLKEDTVIMDQFNFAGRCMQ